MPFACHPAFARRAYRPVSGISVLGDILQSLENESTSAKQQQPQRQCRRARYIPLANPRSDVYETTDEYVVEVELPGIEDKSSVSLEFTDAQTLKIEGSLRRSDYQKKVARDESASEAKNTSSADTDMSDGTLQTEEKPPKYQVSVEETADEDDAMSADFEVIHTPRTNTPAPEAKEKQAEPSLFTEPVPKPDSPTPAEDTTATTTSDAPAARTYWVSERSYGRYNKAFTFTNLVDQAAVRASLSNGILRVNIPKRKPYIRQVNIE